MPKIPLVDDDSIPNAKATTKPKPHEGKARCLPNTKKLTTAEESEAAKDTEGEASPEREKVRQFTKMADAIDVWLDTENQGWATLPGKTGQVHWPLNDDRFAQWLGRRFRAVTGRYIAAPFLKQVISDLTGRAHELDARHKVFLRCASRGGSHYWDLGTEDGKAVKITSAKWHIIDNPPVKFWRSRNMLPAKLPARTRKPLRDLLRPYLRVSDDDFVLVQAWLVAAFREGVTCPILYISGAGGTGKTTIMEKLTMIVSPADSTKRINTNSVEGIFVAARNAWVLGLDNLSGMRGDLCDGLCCLTTGASFTQRAKYTDRDESAIKAQRPIILTSIDEIKGRADLLSRTLTIETVAGKLRRETELEEAFQKDLPEILGAVFDLLASSMANGADDLLDDTQFDRDRLLEFLSMAVSIEQELGCKPGGFLEVYAATKEQAKRDAVDDDPVAMALIKYTDGGRYKGMKPRNSREPLAAGESVEYTAAEWLDRLRSHFDSTASKDLPKTPSVLSRQFNRMAPNLSSYGLSLETSSKGRDRDRRETWICRRFEASATSATPSATKKRSKPR